MSVKHLLCSGRQDRELRETGTPSLCCTSNQPDQCHRVPFSSEKPSQHQLQFVEESNDESD